MHFTDDVADFVESLGPFYEFVDIPITNGKTQDKNHNLADLKKGIDSNGVDESDEEDITNGPTLGEIAEITSKTPDYSQMNVSNIYFTAYLKNYPNFIKREHLNTAMNPQVVLKPNLH